MKEEKLERVKLKRVKIMKLNKITIPFRKSHVWHAANCALVLNGIQKCQ